MNLLKLLIRKRGRNQSILKWLFLQLHLCLGLIAGLLICFISITGVIYLFHREISMIPYQDIVNRESEAKHLTNLEKLCFDFNEQYGQQPSAILIPEDKSKNLSIYGSKRGEDGVTAFADRDSGELIGRTTGKEAAFFHTIMGLHRWLGMDNYKLGRQFVGIATIIFIFMLISGIVLWWPKSKYQVKHKMSLRLSRNFNILNYKLHINYGFYSAIFLVILAITGICFTYDSVRNTVVNAFKTKSANTEIQNFVNEKRIHAEMDKTYAALLALPEEEKKVSYNDLISRSGEELNYNGDIRLSFPNRWSSNIEVRKTNTSNWLGAHLTDKVIFSKSGDLIGVSRFSDKKAYQQVSSLIKPIHTGDIMGMKSKIFYCFLVLLSAYLPISGFLLWWKRVRFNSESDLK